MIQSNKAYPSYRNTGIEWLPSVPSHWNIGPGLSCFRPKQKRNTGMQETRVLSLSYGKIIVKPSDKLHGLVPASFETYQIVDPGDIIIRPTDMQNDHVSLRVGLVKDRGIITSAYLCLQVTNRLIPEYAYLLLHAYDLMKIFYGMGSGLRQNLDFSDLRRMPVIFPPKEEQEAIVQFQNQMDKRIRRLIYSKQRMIRLLNEQKQAIIHQAVTRGLDPNVRLKPSGVEWLGDIPDYWRTIKLSLATDRIGDGLHGTPRYVDSSAYHFINGNNLSSGTIIITPTTRNVSEEEFFKYKIELNDRTLLLSINGTIGNVAFYQGETIILGKSAAYIMCAHPLHRKYLFYFLQSLAVKKYFEQEVTGTTIYNLSLESIRKLRVTIPPYEEQVNISNMLDQIMEKFKKATDKLNSEIDLINRYHIRLVADIVTGKIDVRKANGSLSMDSKEDTFTVEEMLTEIEEVDRGRRLLSDEGDHENGY